MLIYILFLLNFIFSQEAEYQKGIELFEKQKYLESLEILKPFADKGDMVSQYVVGFCYWKEDLGIKNDSIAEIYLLKSSEQKFGRAMGILATIYFGMSMEDSSKILDALYWAEIASAYDFIQRTTSARFLFRSYMTEEQINKVREMLIEKQKTFDQINIEVFDENTRKVLERKD